MKVELFSNPAILGICTDKLNKHRGVVAWLYKYTVLIYNHNRIKRGCKLLHTQYVVIYMMNI